jgi:hypothetical protein
MGMEVERRDLALKKQQLKGMKEHIMIWYVG